jgi:hypothetical protein
MAAAKIMTPKEFALEVDSDPRTVRKFLRSEGMRVGKGHRHEIKATATLRKQFAAWNDARSTETPSDEG